MAGALAGFAIAVPVGAIAILIIQTGLTRGAGDGLAAAAGAATADGIYATVAALAGAGVAALIGPLVVPLRIVGGVVLIGLGVRSVLQLRTSASLTDERAAPTLTPSRRRTYLELLALTLLNPATIVYFAALTVGLPFFSGVGERLAFSTAAFAASFGWQSVLAVLGAAIGRRGGERLRRPTTLLGAAVVMMLGALILYEGLLAV